MKRLSFDNQAIKMKTTLRIMAYRFFALLLLAPFFVPNVIAQSTFGTDFWLTFMPNLRLEQEHPERALYLKMSAERACSGTVTNPRTNWSSEFNVAVNQITTLEIPFEQVYDEEASDTILDIGLHVVATDSISLFAFNFREYSLDASCVFPITALGDDYIVQCYAPNSITGDTAMRSEFSVLALEDNTMVEIQLTSDTKGGHHAGNIFYVVLDAGQCYQVQSVPLGEVDGNLSGTRVRSLEGKKIAVFAGDRGTYIPDSDPFCGVADMIFEQMLPIDTWGKRFIVTSTERRFYDRVRVTAANDNCQVFVDGVLQTTIDAFETYEFEMQPDAPAILLETSEPAEVFMYLTGALYHQSDPLIGDPSMVRISPLEQTMDYVTFPIFINGHCTFHYVNIVVATAYVQNMVLDGQNIASRFSEVASYPEYSFAKIQLGSGVHTLSNPLGGFVAHAYGLGQGESYAYSLGAHSHSLVSQIIVNGETAVAHPLGFDICLNDEPEFDLQTNFNCSAAHWDFGDGTTASGFPIFHSFTEAGNYAVLCDVFKDEQGQTVLVSTLTTAIHVHPNYMSEEYVSVCDAYENNGITYTESGVYDLQGETYYGCDSIVSLHLTVNHSDTTKIHVEACDAYTWYEQTYSQSGIYEHLLESVQGCDSLLLLELEMGGTFSTTENVEACNSYTWRGQTYNATGVYSDTVQNPDDCDSLFVLQLTVNYDVTNDTMATVCDEFTWNGQTYTASGHYEQTLQTITGCDSIVSLDLTVNHAQQLVLQGLSQVYVSTNIIDGIYEYKVTDSVGITPGTLIWSCTVPDWVVMPSESGFSCQLWVTTFGHGILSARTDEDCEVCFSLDIFAEWFDVDENRILKISVFPNPSNGKLMIEGIEVVSVRIYNVLGQLVETVQSTNEIDLDTLPNGIYTICIFSADGLVSCKKIVVE